MHVFREWKISTFVLINNCIFYQQTPPPILFRFLLFCSSQPYRTPKTTPTTKPEHNLFLGLLLLLFSLPVLCFLPPLLLLPFFLPPFRSGDANLCDFLGNTPLHLAAANGHLPCASFLVNFGASIWHLDNDLHSPLDLAVLHDHKEVIDYLDSVVAKQSSMNRRVTKKQQERAVLDAEKRRQAFEKMQEKARKKEEKEEAKRGRQREKMAVVPDNPRPSVSPAISTAVNDADDRRSSKSAFSTTAGVARKIVKKKGGENGSGSRRGSADFRVSESRSGGGRSVRSLAGLRATTDTEVLYVSNNNNNNDNAAGDDGAPMSHDDPNGDDAGLFVRPGFGSVAFLSKQNVSQALLSLPNNENDSAVGDEIDGDGSHPKSCADSIGTARSLMKRMATLPWSEEDVENLDDDEAGSELELFLACHNLTDVMSVLSKEKIDLEALMLCSEEDLKKIGLPLGPRKKILDAVEKRKMTLQNPGCMKDTFF